VLLEQHPVEAGDGDVELQQPPGEVEGLGRGALVLEPPGVADEPGVEADGGVPVERQPEGVDEAGDDDGTGGGGRIDEMERPVPGVRDVVVDDDQFLGCLGVDGQVAETVRKAVTLNDGSAVILSVAKYYSPDGKSIQDNGVTPDILQAETDVAIADGAADDNLPDAPPDEKKSGVDELLNRALKALPQE